MKYKPTLLLVGLAYLGFISIGLPDGLLGVAWPSIRESFNLPLDALGTLLVMFTTGYLVSSFSSGRLLASRQAGMGTLLAFSCLATAISLIGYALAPQWEMMVALGIIAGLGAGAIDAGLNTYAATHFSPRAVNWLHACYGIGATGGPIIMTGVLMASQPWQWGYAIVGMGQLLLAICFAWARKQWSNTAANQHTPPPAAAPAASGSSTLRQPMVWLSIAVFFIYTGIEAAAGAWPYSLFIEARAIPAMTAGLWVSIYWGSFTFGRLVSGIVVHYVLVQRLLRFCILGMICGAALIWLNFTGVLNFLGLALLGLSAAPVFPTLIATTPQRLGEVHTANGVGFQIAAAVLGQSLLPALAGVLASRLGLDVVAPTLLAAAILLLALYEVMAMRCPIVTPTHQ
jgi:fucose permease